MEQTVQSMPWSQMIQNPLNAWLASLPILFILLVISVIYYGNKREDRLTTILDTTLKDHGGIIQQQTTALGTINNSMLQLHSAICKVEDRVDDIEDVLKINKVVNNG